jgi:Thioredoxin like C-terminal domain
MTSADSTPRTVSVLLDGRRIPVAAAGADVHRGLVTVQSQRLYDLVSLPGAEFHTLTVEVPPGVRAYDFTFG